MGRIRPCLLPHWRGCCPATGDVFAAGRDEKCDPAGGLAAGGWILGAEPDAGVSGVGGAGLRSSILVRGEIWL